MTKTYNDLDRAQNEVSASPAGGAPFVTCYGLTFIFLHPAGSRLPLSIANESDRRSQR